MQAHPWGKNYVVGQEAEAGGIHDLKCLVPGCRVIRTGEYGQEYKSLVKEVVGGWVVCI